MARDPFEMESGGNTADYVATIAGVTFAPSKFGQFQATFDNKYETPRPKDDGTLSLGRPEFVTIGGEDQWTSKGDGFISSDGDADKRVRDNSGYGRLLGRVLELVGRDTLIAEGRTDPYTEGFWVGLKFHWETEGAGESYSFKDKDTGEQKSGKTKGYTIPTEYLGGTGASNGQVALFDITTLGLADTTLVALQDQAEAADSAKEFQSKALTIVLSIEDPVEKDNATKALSKAAEMYEALRS